MILERVIAPVFAANCYLLAPAAGSTALVVDPGSGSVDGVLAALQRHDLKIGAVLITHGHADHCWDTVALLESAHAQGRTVVDADSTPVYIPEPDYYRLEDPSGYGVVTPDGLTFADLAATPWQRPRNLLTFPETGFEQAVEFVPGIALRAIPAPGHTEGSTLYFFNAKLADNTLLYEAEAEPLTSQDPALADTPHNYLVSLVGDVIFKGSVGRTDLHGGDQTQMLATLRLLAQIIDPATVFLPGHGSATTMEHEHHGNPYLAEAKIHGGEQL